MVTPSSVSGSGRMTSALTHCRGHVLCLFYFVGKLHAGVQPCRRDMIIAAQELCHPCLPEVSSYYGKRIYVTHKRHNPHYSNNVLYHHTEVMPA